MIPRHVWQAYRLSGPARRLPGGVEGATRIGDVVVKRLVAMSLENPHSLALAPWLAEQISTIHEDGFRISRPIAACDGRWVVDGGWTAWTYLEGRPPCAEDMPAAIEAVRALHRALSHLPTHPLLGQNDSPWGFADAHCWGERPARVHPVLEPWVDALYAKRTPLPPLENQIVHGDLNHENVLIAPGLPPGFIDLTPFWAPADFALAMFANWIGPRLGDPAALRHFEAVPHFDQLLLRAAIRMLLIVSQLGGVKEWEWESERRAAEIVLDYT